MGGYIVLCDHNSKWAEKFTDEAINRNIQTVVVESIAEMMQKKFQYMHCQPISLQRIETKLKTQE